MIIATVLVNLFIIANKDAYAVEGVVELRSTKGEDNRCYAPYVFMPNANFTILVSCRDLIYPPQPSLFNYIAWATPTDGKNPIRLGELGVGKASFNTKKPFSDLFVTIEQSRNPKTPTGEVIMTGSARGIDFLDRPISPTPTEKVAEGEEVELTPKETTTRDKFVLALRRAGLVIFLAFVATIGLIFMLSKSRR